MGHEIILILKQVWYVWHEKDNKNVLIYKYVQFGTWWTRKLYKFKVMVKSGTWMGHENIGNLIYCMKQGRCNRQEWNTKI